MRKEIIKIVKITVALIIIFALLSSFIVSQDTHHLEVCHDHDCSICKIIHLAQNVINVVLVLIIRVFVGFVIYFILSRFYKENNIFVRSSLVFQKVQFNE